MFASHSNWKLRSKSFACLLTVLFLTACSASPTLPSQDKSQVTQSCPPLTPMLQGHLTDYVRKLNEVAGQYNICRRAALAK